MKAEEREALKAFVQKLWSALENEEQFQSTGSEVRESEIREGVDSRLSRGNVALMNRFITTVERSNQRRIDAGLQVYEFDSGH